MTVRIYSICRTGIGDINSRYTVRFCTDGYHTGDRYDKAVPSRGTARISSCRFQVRYVLKCSASACNFGMARQLDCRRAGYQHQRNRIGASFCSLRNHVRDSGGEIFLANAAQRAERALSRKQLSARFCCPALRLQYSTVCTVRPGYCAHR